MTALISQSEAVRSDQERRRQFGGGRDDGRIIDYERRLHDFKEEMKQPRTHTSYLGSRNGVNAQSMKSFGKASDLSAANMRKFDAEYEQESRMSDLLDVREMPKAVS